MNEAQYHGLMLLTILTAYNFLETFDEKELKIKKQRKKAINDVLNENDKIIRLIVGLINETQYKRLNILEDIV